MTIPNISAPGNGIPTWGIHNNWLFQETQSNVRGRHTFRYGIEWLRQLVAQSSGFHNRGSLTYREAPGFSGFANYLDDFSGPSGEARRVFGPGTFYPDMFRQAYFFQDIWKATPSVTWTLGLRYENFGQPANHAFQFPAFAGFDPDQFLVPNRVRRANQNFGPAFGLAWSPSHASGLWGRLFGDGKTVWRGGYQISYDTFFTNHLFFMSADSPMTTNSVATGANTGRGTPNWFAQLPTVARPPSLLDAQLSVFDKNLRNPYTERWSFGFQRELPQQILLDLSYVGSASHHLYTREDLNVLQPNGLRLYPNFGIRRVIASHGNAIYHALQGRVDRRLAKGFQISGSYTWSRNIDSTSEINPTGNALSPFTSVPVSQGGLKLDRALGDYHRQHRLTFLYSWDIPGPTRGRWHPVFGGWSVTGITTFQSGAPFSVANGLDRNGDGILPANDRPDIGNPSAPFRTRAVVDTVRCAATGYRNPDTRACVMPAEVHFVQVERGFPGRATVGRNTLLAGGVNNWDLSLFKTFLLREAKRLEVRWEALNLCNHPQFVEVPERDVGSPGPAPGQPSRFLNRDFTNGGMRTLRVQLKLLF